MLRVALAGGVHPLHAKRWRARPDAVGRDYYEHGAQPGQEYSAPQIAGRDEPFRSAIRGISREPVLAAWGFTIKGRRVLLHMMAGSMEDAETVTAFFEDMKRRGLKDPLLVTSR